MSRTAGLVLAFGLGALLVPLIDFIGLRYFDRSPFNP